MTERMHVISVSGMDKSGKTTLIRAFNEATEWTNFVVDRDPSAVLFYSHLLNRPNFLRHWNLSEVDFNTLPRFNPDLAVFLHAQPSVLANRFAATNEPKLPGPLDMAHHQTALSEYFRLMRYERKLTLDTGYLTVDECVNKMLNELEEIENADKQ